MSQKPTAANWRASKVCANMKSTLFIFEIRWGARKWRFWMLETWQWALPTRSFMKMPAFNWKNMSIWGSLVKTGPASQLWLKSWLARSCRSRAISSGRKTPRSAIWINMLIFRRGWRWFSFCTRLSRNFMMSMSRWMSFMQDMPRKWMIAFWNELAGCRNVWTRLTFTRLKPKLSALWMGWG